MMMNSPLRLIQMIQRGGNPQQLVMQAAQNNLILRQAMQAVNGRTPEQVRDMAYQMARKQGVDLDKLAKQLGIKLPK